MFDELTKQGAYHRFWEHGLNAKRLPGIIVPTQTPRDFSMDGWKAKARFVGCGNFEEHIIGTNLNTRADDLDLFERRMLVAEAATNGWGQW